jgi:hypothetical protein
MEYCTQNTFFVHQNPDNVFSDLTMVHDTISLHGVIRTPPVEFKKKIQRDATVFQNFISYLHEAQHVSGDTPPIIRSLKLH